MNSLEARAEDDPSLRFIQYSSKSVTVLAAVIPPKTEENPVQPLERIAAQRVLGSQTFEKSERLRSMLHYIVERTMEGRFGELTEQQIGIRVFGRSADFDPAADNIVRKTVRQLRHKLALYYLEEGARDSLRLVIPKGKYAAGFVSAEEPPLPPLPEIPPLPASRPALPFCAGVLAGLLLCAAAFYAWRAPWSLPAPDLLWASLFSPAKKTLIVPGDAGLNMYWNITGQQVTLDSYVSRAYLRNQAAQTPSGVKWAPFPERRYTSLSDTLFVSNLLQLEIPKDLVEVRFARDMRLEDLKTSNLILLGAPPYNPWVDVFSPATDFQIISLAANNSITIHNKKPAAGEKSDYAWSEEYTSDGHARTANGYALISLLDNPYNHARVLLVEGTTMIGLRIANDFLFDRPRLNKLLAEARLPNGTLRNFDCVLSGRFIDAGALNIQVAAKHFH